MVGERRSDAAIDNFHWDYSPDANVDHIGRHSVTPEDVEEVAVNEPHFYSQPHSDRTGCVMVGTNQAGRYLFAAMIEMRERGTWYVITAHWLDRRRGARYYNS